MKIIVNKIIIWITGLSLVLVFTFGQLRFDKKENVTYQINTEMVLETEAFGGLILTAVALVALSVYLSLGSQHTADVVTKSADQFVDWYTNWYNDTSFEGQNDWQRAHSVEDYLKQTGQADSMGNLTNPDSVVLPKDILTDMYRNGDWFINNVIENDTSWVQHKRFDYTSYYSESSTKSLPIINGNYAFYTWTQMSFFSSPSMAYLKLNDPSISGNYFILNNSVMTTLRMYDQTSTTKRLRFSMHHSDRTQWRLDTGLWDYDSYSSDLSFSQIDEIVGADYYLFLYEQVTRKFVLFPILNGQTISTSWSKRVTFTNAMPLTQSWPYNVNKYFVTQSSPTAINWNQTNISLLDENGFPNTNDTPIDNTGNYYIVPVIPNGSDIPVTNNPVITVPPTPVSPEDEHLYTYIPPTTPGVVPKVDIGTGMPTTPDLEETNDPTITVPLPGVDDLLDGTYFKDMAVWFSGWLAITISNITEFWNTAWSNLTLGINWLGLSMKSLLDNMLDALMYPMNLMLDGVNSIRNNTDKTNWFTDATAWLTGLFVPSDLDIKFTALMDFFNTKFGLLLYPFELIIDIVDRFMLLEGVDRISFYGFTEHTSGVTILPAFYIDIGDMRSQYDFLDYIFATIKMLVTSFFIFNFIRFLYYYYEDVRDS